MADRPACSRDTDGDGNCGARHCPECGPLTPEDIERRERLATEGIEAARQKPHQWKTVVVESVLEGTKTISIRDDWTLCETCKGAGHFDSCFDCGNRGYDFPVPT